MQLRMIPKKVYVSIQFYISGRIFIWELNGFQRNSISQYLVSILQTFVTEAFTKIFFTNFDSNAQL